MAGKRTNNNSGGGHAAQVGDRSLRTYAVGAMPIVNRLLQRMKLEQLFSEHLQPDGPRMEVPTQKALLVLLRNLLFSEKTVIISRKDAYHGSTIAATSMGGMGAMHDQLGPKLPGFVHVMAPYAFELAQPGESDEEFGKRAAQAVEDAILAAGQENVAAFVGEPVMGAGGVKIPPANYWGEIQRICKKYDILLMVDEVITGFGRTGAWFACQSMGIVPDTITVAKGLTSGYQPLSALLVGDRIANVLAENGEYFHGYTFSGHPVCCAVALANLDIIEREGLIERVRDDTGPYLVERFTQVVGDHPLVGEVRGFGFLAAVEIVRDRETRERFEPPGHAAVVVRDQCIANGMMLRAVGETMILSPPFTWTRETIDSAADILKTALDKAQDLLRNG